MSSQLPPVEHLAGDWKLNAGRSDDLGKAVDELRAQSAKGRHKERSEEQQQQQQQGAGPYGGRRRRGGAGPGGEQGGQSGQGEGQPGGGSGGQELGPSPHVSAVDELMSHVPQGDYLRITVNPTSFTVISGASSDQYTPGLQTDISAEQGDAQQISGWKGERYVIDTTPQFGPEIIQTFDLTKDGKLEVILRLSGHGVHYTFTRVYDRTTSVSPLAPPTIN